jgi:hypothetical protein
MFCSILSFPRVPPSFPGPEIGTRRRPSSLSSGGGHTIFEVRQILFITMYLYTNAEIHVYVYKF